MRTRTAVLAAVLGTALALPSTALADKNFEGKTAQNRTVGLTTGDDNVLKTFRINWITRRCAQSGSRFQHMTAFRPPFDLATGDEFRDAGAFTVRDDGGIRSRVRIAITGRRNATDPAAESWAGTIRASIVVRRRGRVIDRCNLRSTTWNAALA